MRVATCVCLQALTRLIYMTYDGHWNFKCWSYYTLQGAEYKQNLEINFKFEDKQKYLKNMF